MKKLLVVLAVNFVCLSTSIAQEIGIRLGDIVGNDAAVDFMLPTGSSARLHGDISFGDDVGAELLYNFINQRLGDTIGLNWYAGVGGSVLFADDLFLGVCGEIGIEYRFDDVPIVLGADWRPVFWVIEETDLRGDSFGLNIRYAFGN